MARRRAHAADLPALEAVPVERRSQAERAEQMRARLLDATIECLAEQGYGQMSTNDVVRRAAVSRGALAHHFPTKTDLVKAAAQRLLDRRAEEFRARFAALPAARRTPAEALAVLWSFYDDPSAVALVELTVAARTDPELRIVVGSVPEQIASTTNEVFTEFFPDLAALPFADESLRAVHALFTGLVVSAMATGGGGEADEHGADVRAFLKVLVSLGGQIAPILARLPARAVRAASVKHRPERASTGRSRR
jgi:AcrR family transcriptional regulator